MRFTERTARKALGLAGGSEQVVYAALQTDSRALTPGALFVALPGERFDGHDFLPAAHEAAAAAAVVREGTPGVAGLTLHHVPDTLRAWGHLARARRRAVPGPVIAITGTNGKTSVKELVAAVLRTRLRTWATRANLNNLVGVPQTILEAPDDTEALVVEAGANLPGEIARYREIIEPEITIVTNAAAGHLEGFGSLDAVVAEKLELTRGVGTVLTGTEPAFLAAGARERGAGRVVTVGLADAEVTPDRLELTPEARPVVTVNGRTFTLRLLGRHQAANALFAWAIARELGLDLDQAARALEEVVLPAGRGQVLQLGGLTVLHDCYNANPLSFRAVMDVARRLRGDRRLVFVAGSMRELGPDAERLHREVAAELMALDPDLLAAVGDFVPALAPWAASLGERLVTAGDVPALGEAVAARLRGDELVVLKASRGVALERILPALTRHSAPSAEA